MGRIGEQIDTSDEVLGKLIDCLYDDMLSVID